MSHHIHRFVRVARPDELPAIQGVLRRAYAEHAGPVPAVLFEAYLADLLRVGPGATPLVAVAGRRVIGTARLHLDGATTGHGVPASWAAVRAVGVDPRFRRNGVGRALMAAAASRAARSGAEVLALHTANFMSDAVRLYERLGYERVPELDMVPTKHYEVSADSRIVALAYRLDLAQAGERCTA